MKILLTVAAMLSLAATNAVAAPKAPPPTEPAHKPDWAVARQQGEAQLTNVLFDPSSAQIQYASGFQWGYLKPIIGRRTYGWIACGSVNAKNRMGGYVGAQTFLIFIDPNRAVTAALAGQFLSTCDHGPAVPIQSALQTTPVTATTTAAAPSIADELGKLAELRDKGIITQTEFDAQKAKLLARQ